MVEEFRCGVMFGVEGRGLVDGGSMWTIVADECGRRMEGRSRDLVEIGQGPAAASYIRVQVEEGGMAEEDGDSEVVGQ